MPKQIVTDHTEGTPAEEADRLKREREEEQEALWRYIERRADDDYVNGTGRRSSGDKAK
jgi:hypothetical protein